MTEGQSGHAICEVPRSNEFVIVSARICPLKTECFNFTSRTPASQCYNTSNIFIKILNPREVELFIINVNRLKNNSTRISCDYNPILGLSDSASKNFGPQTAVIYIQGM